MSSGSFTNQPCDDCFRLAQLESEMKLNAQNAFFYKKWCTECVQLAQNKASRARQFYLSHNPVLFKPTPTGGGGFRKKTSKHNKKGKTTPFHTK